MSLAFPYLCANKDLWTLFACDYIAPKLSLLNIFDGHHEDIVAQLLLLPWYNEEESKQLVCKYFVIRTWPQVAPPGSQEKRSIIKVLLVETKNHEVNSTPDQAI